MSKRQRTIETFIDLTESNEENENIVIESQQSKINVNSKKHDFKEDPEGNYLIILDSEEEHKPISVKIEDEALNGLKKYDKVKCKVCKLTFQKQSIKNHLAIHFRKEDKCNKCGKIFISKSRFRRHDCNKICHLCQKKFDSRALLRNHLRRFHHGDLKIATFTCDLCGVLYFTKMSLIEHMKVTHPNGKILKFICDHDGKIFVSKPKLTLHMRANHELRKCKHCDEYFKCYNLKYHMDKVHGDDTIIGCKLCKIKCFSRRGLEIHMTKQHGSLNECNICNRKFSQSILLKNHMIRMHSEQNDFRCKFCQKKFYTKKHLDQHLKRLHSKGEIRKYICDYDGKIYYNRQDMHRHIKLHYSKVKCEICNKEMAAITLSSHMRFLHPTNPNIACKICSRMFKSEKYLKNHLKSHDKQHECDICQKKFGTNFVLKKHKETHTNTRKFVCKVCHKGFKYEPTLRNHMKLHLKNRPKPFKCPKCEYSTDEKGNLVRHIKTHDNFDKRQKKRMEKMKNPLQCDECKLFFSNKHVLKTHKDYVHSKNIFQCDLCAAKLKYKSCIKIHFEKWCNKLYPKL